MFLIATWPRSFLSVLSNEIKYLVNSSNDPCFVSTYFIFLVDRFQAIVSVVQEILRGILHTHHPLFSYSVPVAVII